MPDCLPRNTPTLSMTTSDPIPVALIGCGMRATAYFRNIPDAIRSRVRLSAVADPSAENREFFISRFGDPETRHYADAESLLEQERASALVIASPNHHHAAQLIKALDWNVPILMEKPVCVTLEQCREIWSAWEASAKPPVAVGFVLRYTPFYRKIGEIIASGELGQILQVEGNEIIGTALTSLFFRDGWRLSDELSGGMLLEKCCHDLDVLSLVAGAPVRRVISFAQRTHFVARPREEQHRRFDPAHTRMLSLDYGDLHIKRYFETVSDASVYSGQSDVPDHQSVMLEYENGVLGLLGITFGQPRQTRLIRVIGSNGTLWGDISDGIIEYEIAGADAKEVHRQRLTIESDSSGHNGADSVINESFWAYVAGDRDQVIRAGLREGIEAVIAGICAEQSRREERVISVADARDTIFCGGPVLAGR